MYVFSYNSAKFFRTAVVKNTNWTAFPVTIYSKTFQSHFLAPRDNFLEIIQFDVFCSNVCHHIKIVIDLKLFIHLKIIWRATQQTVFYKITNIIDSYNITNKCSVTIFPCQYAVFQKIRSRECSLRRTVKLHFCKKGLPNQGGGSISSICKLRKIKWSPFKFPSHLFEEGISFWHLTVPLKALRNSVYVFDSLYFIQYLFSLYLPPSSRNVFDAVSSNKDKILKFNPSVHVDVLMYTSLKTLMCIIKVW